MWSVILNSSSNTKNWQLFSSFLRIRKTIGKMRAQPVLLNNFTSLTTFYGCAQVLSVAVPRSCKPLTAVCNAHTIARQRNRISLRKPGLLAHGTPATCKPPKGFAWAFLASADNRSCIPRRGFAWFASPTEVRGRVSVANLCKRFTRVSAMSQSRQARKDALAPQLSGEIFKEPFVDIFLTDLEQTAFSLSASSNQTSFHSNSLYWRKLRAKGVNAKLDKEYTSNSKASSRANRGKAVQSKITQIELHVKIGDYVCSGDKIGESCVDGWRGPLVVSASGKVIRISGSQIVLQKTQPVLYYSQANVHVRRGEWIKQNAPILTLTNQTLVTGDIVQGIPRIEQLFEAPHSPPPGTKERALTGAPSSSKAKSHLHETLHSQVREIFRQNWRRLALPAAVRRSLEQIQQILVESIQKVYLSQGVLIADKHIEIVVRQMTSKAEVLDSGDTGLLLEELLPVQNIENANLATPGKKALYAPAVVGLTRSALESDSFISAASFQETTRVLSRDATIGKSDFLRGLKEKVVIGDLISAGTGLDAYFVYTLLSPRPSSSSMQIEMAER